MPKIIANCQRTPHVHGAQHQRSSAAVLRDEYVIMRFLFESQPNRLAAGFNDWIFLATAATASPPKDI